MLLLGIDGGREACVRPNQDYLVPYKTAFLLYITVRTAVTWTAFTMGDEDL